MQQQLLDLLPREQRHDEAVVAPVSVKSTATIVRVAGIEQLLPIEQPPLVHHFLVTGAACGCGDVRVAFGPDCPPRVPDHERLAQDGAATQLSRSPKLAAVDIHDGDAIAFDHRRGDCAHTRQCRQEELEQTARVLFRASRELKCHAPRPSPPCRSRFCFFKSFLVLFW